MDDSYLQLLVESGCNKLQCGGESGSQRILNLLHKGIKVKDILNFVIRTTKIGIIPLVAFMTGIPTETKKEQRETLRLIRDILYINPKAIINGPATFRPYPGGELYNMCVERYNLKMPKTLEEWAKINMLGGNRPPWVKRNYLNMYLWTSTKIATYTTKYIKDRLRKRPLRGLKFLILTPISKIRLRYVFYKFPIEFFLLYLHDRYIKRKVPNFS